MKETKISMKKKLEFKANRSVDLMINTDFSKEKTIKNVGGKIF